MKKIQLTKGEFALVDDEDFGFLNRLSWKFSSEGYAIARVTINENKRHDVAMHRLIMNPYTELVIDHKNGIKIDNRRENLRIINVNQNTFNRPPKRFKVSSVYKGVTKPKNSKKFVARITVAGKLIQLGNFEKERDAADAYDEAARRYFGEHGWLNTKLNT